MSHRSNPEGRRGEPFPVASVLSLPNAHRSLPGYRVLLGEGLGAQRRVADDDHDEGYRDRRLCGREDHYQKNLNLSSDYQPIESAWLS